jgi:hypothetical protein
MKLKDSVKFILTVPQYDSDTKLYKALDPASIKPLCPVAEIMCEGVGSGGASNSADQKDMKRAQFPPFKNITCANKLSDSDIHD